jgi:hypothetical protein
MDRDAPMHIYLLPVDGLKIDTEWSIGSVRLYRTGSAERLVEEARQARLSSGGSLGPAALRDLVDARLMETFSGSAIARVEATNERLAYDRASDALGVLRLFAAWRSPMTNTEQQSFGLAGELPLRTAEYIDLAAGPAPGWFREGTFAWQELDSVQCTAFQSSPGAQFLVSCLDVSGELASQLQRRSMLGQRLLNQAIFDQQPDRKVISLVVGLEVLFGEQEWQGKGYGLARRIAFLTCGAHNGQMCGRDRPSCPYLALDPAKGPSEELRELVRNASVATHTYCARYLEILRLYRWRTDAVHEGSCRASADEIRTLGWPIYSWLLPAFFEWCAAHPTDEVSLLDAEIADAVRRRPPP